MNITKKQKEVLTAIVNITTQSGGQPPTLKELKDFLGFKSISAVQRHTQALKKKGYLSNEKKGKQRNLLVKDFISKLHNIPLVGSVTCGTPILAIENIEAFIPVEIKGDPKEFFCLRAIGDSMNLAGINDGDYLLVKKQSSANNGDVVVALIGDEATVKIYREEKDRIVLEPRSKNAIHKPIYLFDDIIIQGIVVDKI